MPLQVSLNAVIWVDWGRWGGGGGGGGAKVKPDHGQYLAMIELHKTDYLIRLSLYELIRVLFREYMSVFTIFPILYCPKTQHLAYRGNFPLHTVFKQNTKSCFLVQCTFFY